MEKYHPEQSKISLQGSKKGSDKEKKERFKNFVKAKKQIERINKDKSLPYQAIVNKFSTMTIQERNLHHGLNISRGFSAEEREVYIRHISKQPSLSLESASNPASLDQTKKGIDIPIKDQGSCGSCWAFGTVFAIEGAYYKATGNLVEFSEQEILDCSYEFIEVYGEGCDGGSYRQAMKYIYHHARLASSKDAEYRAQDDVCNYRNVPNSFKNTVLTRWENFGGTESILNALQKGVMATRMFSTPEFELYHKGIFLSPICDEYLKPNQPPNHGVNTVGYGQQDGHNFWKIRNSWGTDWGEEGYARFTRDHGNHCHITYDTYLPIIERKENVIANCWNYLWNDDCDAFRHMGGCEPGNKLNRQVTVECKLMCGACEKNADNNKNGCVNMQADSYCDSRKDQCKKEDYNFSYYYMSENCRKTCGLCGKDGDDNNRDKKTDSKERLSSPSSSTTSPISSSSV